MTIAKVAHLAWPEEYPNFIDDMVICLRSPDQNVVSGAIRVLSDFVRDDLSDIHFTQVAPILLPELYRLFRGNLEPSLRARIISTLSEFVEIIYMIKDESANGLRNQF